ncbi:MAG: pyridoxal phosphate-dependent aminotransferase [Fastidiosipilaceae bacterium]|jgi:aminotransferase
MTNMNQVPSKGRDDRRLAETDVTPGQRISNRVNSIPPSGIRRFFDLAAEMKGECLSLSIGEPDFVTPWHIRDAGIFSLEEGYTHYTANQGMINLREEICDYMERRFNLRYNPLNEVVVTVGGSEAIDDAVRALIDPGDEVLVPEPCFVAYKANVSLAGGVAVTIPLRQENHFKLTPEELEAAITERTKLIIIGYPNNPTGAIMTREDLAKLVPVFERHPQVTILSDELYAELTYPPAEPYSLANFPSLYERTVIIGGFSKTFAMTGWRIGFALAPEPIAEAINKIHQYVIMSAPTTAQYAAVEALKNGMGQVLAMREEYDRRRNFIFNRLTEMGIPCFEPLGAFYIFPSIVDFGLSSGEFCERFLQEEKVAIVPGSAFGECGEGNVRISYAASFETIKEAMDRLERFTQRLRQQTT